MTRHQDSGTVVAGQQGARREQLNRSSSSADSQVKHALGPRAQRRG